MQTRFKDKTLSITKVEKGSIILIVESSQTGYEQFKRLIGQEIAGFPVDYAIDEWQAICRQMLIDRKPLTSNTVIGRVYGDRNLIDEDLFVDLALVKPKRSQTEKHSQEIDPEKGSDLFTRQEETIEKRFAYQEFLEEVISNRSEKQLAIIGEPGAGKTTLLRKLAFWLLQETDDLVILVDLAELGNQPLGEYLEQKWLKEALGLSREEIKADWEHKFKGGAVRLLLDGLDEMSQSDQQALNFRGWVMNAPIIVTCRLNLWQANPSQLQGFQTYLTQPFQDEQVQEFIRRWFRVEADAESLWSQLQAAGKERIKDLCRNPLRLTLLCATWKVEDALPETTAELYAGFVESMYAWKETAFEVTEEDKERLNAALGVLAKASLEAETGRFRLTHRLVCEHLGKLKAKGSLFPLALRLGWLNEVGVAAEKPREKVYGFYHATFQEYFAALAVEDWDYFLPKDHVDCPVEGNRYRIFEPQWKQVILLWLGREDVGDEKKEEFIRALVEFKDGCRDFYGYQADFLAAAAINEFKACSLAAEIVRQVVKRGFGDFNVEKQKWWIFLDPIQKEARKIIPETIRQQTISELIAIFERCPNDFICISAAYSLGQIDPSNPKAIAALVQILETTDNENVRRRAAYSLGQIDPSNPKAIAALVQILETTDNENVRRNVAYSLGQIDSGNLKVTSALASILESTRNKMTHWSVVYSLSEIARRNSAKIASLVRISQATQNKLTSWNAVSSLTTISQRNPEETEAIVRIFITIYNKFVDNGNILEKIVQGSPEEIEDLVWIFTISQDKYTGWSATDLLKRIVQNNPKASTDLVCTLATNQDESTRRRVTDILEKVAQGNSKGIADLIWIITDDRNQSPRRSATENSRWITQENSKTIAALIGILQTTEDKDIRENAAESLEKILTTPQQYAGVVSALKDCLSDEVYQNNFKQFNECYKVIWNCAENLPYPEFYQAWHHPPTTPHPEVTG